MLRPWNRLFTLAAAASIIAGCSGGHSMTPAVNTQSGKVEQASLSQAGLSRLSSQPPTYMQLGWLMTDGTVLAQANQSNLWYRYTPDKTGSYSDGTWAQVASLPSGYAPTAFASAVLADGRLVISGGEYNSPGQYDSN